VSPHQGVDGIVLLAAVAIALHPSIFAENCKQK
jgi:hypothetical protein